MHVDIDPAEISKIRTADVPIVGDLKDVLVDLLAGYREAITTTTPDLDEWWATLDGLRRSSRSGSPVRPTGCSRRST